MSEEQRQEIMELIERENGFLRGQAYGLARNSEDAEDLFQETIMKAYRGFGSFRPDTNFRAWIGRIMLNTHINNYNRGKLATDVSCDLSSGECDNVVFHGADEERISTLDNPERIFFYNYVDDNLVAALYSLPDAYKRPFTLYHLEGYSYEEISLMLNIPIGTVKSRIFRARRTLREAVEAAA